MIFFRASELPELILCLNVLRMDQFSNYGEYKYLEWVSMDAVQQSTF